MESEVTKNKAVKPKKIRLLQSGYIKVKGKEYEVALHDRAYCWPIFGHL